MGLIPPTFPCCIQIGQQRKDDPCFHICVTCKDVRSVTFAFPQQVCLFPAVCHSFCSLPYRILLTVWSEHNGSRFLFPCAVCQGFVSVPLKLPAAPGDACVVYDRLTMAAFPSDDGMVQSVFAFSHAPKAHAWPAFNPEVRDARCPPLFLRPGR